MDVDGTNEIKNTLFFSKQCKFCIKCFEYLEGMDALDKFKFEEIKDKNNGFGVKYLPSILIEDSGKLIYDKDLLNFLMSLQKKSKCDTPQFSYQMKNMKFAKTNVKVTDGGSVQEYMNERPIIEKTNGDKKEHTIEQIDSKEQFRDTDLEMLIKEEMEYRKK
jgi:hypothetical protein